MSQVSVADELISQGLITECPDDGAGCNSWNYKTVIQLLAAGVDNATVKQIVRELSKRTDLAKLKDETERHIERGLGYLALDEEAQKKLRSRKRPNASFDYECLLGQVDQSINPYEILEEATEECCNSAEYLTSVFGGHTACVLRNTRMKRDLFWPRAKAVFDDLLEGEDGVFFLNNPVKGSPVNGSWRSKECVTQFRHLVIECDHPEKENPGLWNNWLRYLIQLPLPIKSIVTSGGKSVHALVDLGTETESQFEKVAYELHEPLVMSGADPISLTSVRLTRLPYSLRKSKGTMQELLYLNTSPTERPIHG